MPEDKHERCWPWPSGRSCCCSQQSSGEVATRKVHSRLYSKQGNCPVMSVSANNLGQVHCTKNVLWSMYLHRTYILPSRTHASRKLHDLTLSGLVRHGSPRKLCCCILHCLVGLPSLCTCASIRAPLSVVNPSVCQPISLFARQTCTACHPTRPSKCLRALLWVPILSVAGWPPGRLAAGLAAPSTKPLPSPSPVARPVLLSVQVHLIAPSVSAVFEASCVASSTRWPGSRVGTDGLTGVD